MLVDASHVRARHIVYNFSVHQEPRSEWRTLAPELWEARGPEALARKCVVFDPGQQLLCLVTYPSLLLESDTEGCPCPHLLATMGWTNFFHHALLPCFSALAPTNHGMNPLKLWARINFYSFRLQALGILSQLWKTETNTNAKDGCGTYSVTIW